MHKPTVFNPSFQTMLKLALNNVYCDRKYLNYNCSKCTSFILNLCDSKILVIEIFCTSVPFYKSNAPIPLYRLVHTSLIICILYVINSWHNILVIRRICFSCLNYCNLTIYSYRVQTSNVNRFVNNFIGLTYVVDKLYRFD